MFRSKATSHVQAIPVDGHHKWGLSSGSQLRLCLGGGSMGGAYDATSQLSATPRAATQEMHYFLPLRVNSLAIVAVGAAVSRVHGVELDKSN